MVRIPGMFKSYDDLEENLSLNDLEALLEKAREVEHNRQRFAASLKGINLDEGNTESVEERFERVKRRAQAKLRGMDEEEFEFAEIGIGFNQQD
jgi:hypothetical protein